MIEREFRYVWRDVADEVETAVFRVRKERLIMQQRERKWILASGSYDDYALKSMPWSDWTDIPTVEEE